MKPHKATIITIIEMTIYVAVIIWLQWYGVGILLLYWVAFGLWQLYKNKGSYLIIKHYIESVIWGKPLYLFKKGELKNTKVKIVWRSDKNGNIKKK